MAWTGLFGVASIEPCGQVRQVVAGSQDRDGFFAECARPWIQLMDLRWSLIPNDPA